MKIFFIIAVILLIALALLAWAPWMTDEHIKSVITKKYCNSTYQKEGETYCTLNRNFDEGTYNGTNVTMATIYQYISWVPFGRIATNYEGMIFVPFYN